MVKTNCSVTLHRNNVFPCQGHFFPERSRHLSTFNGANDCSHRELFTYAIRLEKHYFCKSCMDIRIGTQPTLVSLVSLVPVPNIHVTFAKTNMFPI